MTNSFAYILAISVLLEPISQAKQAEKLVADWIVLNY